MVMGPRIRRERLDPMSKRWTTGALYLALSTAGCSSGGGAPSSNGTSGSAGASSTGTVGSQLATGGANGSTGGSQTLLTTGAGGRTTAVGGSSGLGGSGPKTSAATGGTTTCGPAACAADSCGEIVDWCGNQVSCGDCTAGSICGLLVPNVCTQCTPISCAERGADCGYIADGCGGLVNCGTCEAPLECGTLQANRCGNTQGGSATNPCANPSAGFCPRVANCSSAAADTTVSGTVLAPNGILPLPNALVYVPNGSTSYPYGVTSFVDGVSNGACECNVSGDPLVSTTSRVDGSFTLTGVPVGDDVPLVIQLGRWRRMVTIPHVTECAVTPISADLTKLPTRQEMGSGMDSLPLIALSTGSVDALECVLRKMGVEDSQFSNAGGTGRIRFYRDNGADCVDGRGSCKGTTPDYDQLTGSQAELDQYDALVFPCNSTAHDISSTRKKRVLDVASSTTAYVNKGGRAFFTHFSYSWLYNHQPSTGLPWRSTTDTRAVDTPSRDTHHDPATPIQIDTSFARGATFAQWLGQNAVGALSNVNPPEIEVYESRWNMRNLSSWDNAGPAQRWAFYPDDDPNPAVLHVTFDTPWGEPPEKQCGRVLFSDFHVTTAALSGASCAETRSGARTTYCTFPDECSDEFTAQEKVLAYFMFDMTSCVRPPELHCVPKTCEDLGSEICGPQGDGCGGALDCGSCCTPLTCDQICADPALGCSGTSDPALYSIECLQSDGCNDVARCYCKVG